LQTAILIEYQDKMEVERVREFLPSWTSPYWPFLNAYYCTQEFRWDHISAEVHILQAQPHNLISNFIFEIDSWSQILGQSALWRSPKMAFDFPFFAFYPCMFVYDLWLEPHDLEYLEKIHKTGASKTLVGEWIMFVHVATEWYSGEHISKLKIYS
jgi:hypothetical protein